MLKMSSKHISVHMNTSERGQSHTFRCPRSVGERFERHKKCVGEVSLYFQMELNVPGIFKFPQR